jgi:hypothetical protein
MNPFDAILNNIDQNDGISTICMFWLGLPEVFSLQFNTCEFFKNQD